MSANRKVVLQGVPIIDEQLQCSEAITPGHLVEIDSGKYRKHAGSAGAAAAVFAIERDELGKDMDTAYATNDYIKVAKFAPGDRVNAFAPSGQTITLGAECESNGDGTLKAGTTKPIGRWAEQLGAITVTTRVAVDIV